MRRHRGFLRVGCGAGGVGARWHLHQQNWMLLPISTVNLSSSSHLLSRLSDDYPAGSASAQARNGNLPLVEPAPAAHLHIQLHISQRPSRLSAACHGTLR